MNKNSYIDSAVIHYENISNKLLANLRRKHLNNTDFSIISNNCWGGHVYRRYGLPYLSPTIGLYFYTNEYMMLLSDLEHKLYKNLSFISYKQSKYRDDLIKKGQIDVPIGLLNDEIEIVFLHYKSENEAYEKWNRRCERVNHSNMIIKLSQMNGCTNEHLLNFDNLQYEKKVAFVTTDSISSISCGIEVKKYSNFERVLDDTTYYNSHIDLLKLINGEK